MTPHRNHHTPFTTPHHATTPHTTHVLHKHNTPRTRHHTTPHNSTPELFDESSYGRAHMQREGQQVRIAYDAREYIDGADVKSDACGAVRCSKMQCDAKRHQ